jgi:hypothetical protein
MSHLLKVISTFMEEVSFQPDVAVLLAYYSERNILFLQYRAHQDGHDAIAIY